MMLRVDGAARWLSDEGAVVTANIMVKCGQKEGAAACCSAWHVAGEPAYSHQLSLHFPWVLSSSGLQSNQLICSKKCKSAAVWGCGSRWSLLCIHVVIESFGQVSS